MADLPDKQYFKIGEVARIVGVKPSVLRYWETEFRTVRPDKTRTNQRLYGRRHVERLVQNKDLLYEQKFTIAGARRRLREPGSPGADGEGGDGAPELSARARKVLEKVRRELNELSQLCAD